MDKANKISVLLDKLRRHTLSEEESAYLVTMFQNEHPDSELQEFYQLEWERNSGARTPSGSGILWEKTAARLGIYPETKTRKTINMRWLSVLKYAAVFVIAFIGAWMLQKTIPVTKVAGHRDLYNTVITVPDGSKSDIQLPDGSVVKLNAGSTLSYPSSFEASNRTVRLEGEGFFTIRKDPARPFFVNTTDIFVKVLGTVFNVKSYADENTIETTLVSGSVEVYDGLKAEGNPLNEKPAVVLKPNERATYFKNSDPEESVDSGKWLGAEKKQGWMVIDKLDDAETYIGWKDNILKFDNEPFGSIIRKLERWYGVRIDLKAPELNNERFSGQFDLETIDQALNAIALTESFSFNIKKNIVTVYQQ